MRQPEPAPLEVGLVKNAKQMQQDDDEDRNACEPEDDIAEHGFSSF
jgi:hypothetical protein